MRLAAHVLAIVIAFAAAKVQADSGPTEQDLKKAADVYAAAINKARADMLPKIEKAIDDVRKNKSIPAEDRPKAIDDLKRQQEAFEEEGTLPDVPALKQAGAAYQKAADAAAAKLDVIFNKAINAYSKQGKDTKAAAFLRYRNQLVVGAGYELVGEWRLAEGKNDIGYDERFVIRKTGGRWSVERSFYNESGELVGSSAGKSGKFSNGTLQYTEEYQKKPRPEWINGVKASIKLEKDDSDQLEMRWSFESRGLSGQHTLVRAKLK